MLALRYGVDETLPFSGADVDPNLAILEAYLTIKDTWADDAEEEGPDPPRLQLAITPTPSADGQITQPQDGFGNWSLFFNLTVPQTTNDLEPPPRVLWYEVTLKAARIASP